MPFILQVRRKNLIPAAEGGNIFAANFFLVLVKEKVSFDQLIFCQFSETCWPVQELAL